jgi:hypothetical protein
MISDACESTSLNTLIIKDYNDNYRTIKKNKIELSILTGQ